MTQQLRTVELRLDQEVCATKSFVIFRLSITAMMPKCLVSHDY